VSATEWTDKRPTEYGHYWLKEADEPPVVVRVAPWTIGAASTDMLRVVWFHGNNCEDPIEMVNGLWAGPINPPASATDAPV